MKTKHLLLAFSASLLFILIGVLYVEAQENKKELSPLMVGSPVEMHIGNLNDVLVRGAEVLRINSSSIDVKVKWGNYTANWVVKPEVDKIFYRYGAHGRLSDIQVGDFISFSGTLDTNSPELTVKAKVIRDWSLQKRFGASFSGRIQSIESSSFKLRTLDGEVLVKVSSLTQIKKASQIGTFSDLGIGDGILEINGIYNVLSKILIAEEVIIEADNNSGSNNEIFEGVIKFMASKTLPTKIILSNENGEFTINLTIKSSILDKIWMKADLAKFRTGDKIRVYGTLKNNEIEGGLIRNASL